MPYNINFIKNPPTSEEIINLYTSTSYQNLCDEFELQTAEKIIDLNGKSSIIQSLKRHFLILNIPMSEVIKEWELNQVNLLRFSVEKNRFYKEKQSKMNDEGEIPVSEDLGDENRSLIIEQLGISKTIFLNNFCEFYLLKQGDKNRILHYFKSTRMPHRNQHLSIIRKAFKSTISK